MINLQLQLLHFDYTIRIIVAGKVIAVYCITYCCDKFNRITIAVIHADTNSNWL